MRVVGRILLIVAAAAVFAAPGLAGGTHGGSTGHTRPELLDAPVFIKSFAEPGSEPGQLSDPWHVALLPSGDLVIADTGNDRIQIFTRFGRFLSEFGSTGTGPGEFSGPRGVAVDTDGNIFVSDTGNHRVQVFDDDGGFLRQFGIEGSASGEFLSPGGIDVTPSGEVVVADSGNHRVQTLDSFGSPMSELGEFGSGDGQLDTPIDVTVDLAGRVFVAEQVGGRVSLFDADGTFLFHISSRGAGEDQLMEPSAVFIDDHELLHVLDTGNGRVQGFVGNDDYRLGEYRWSFSEPAGVNAPRGLVVDEHGRTFVSDGGAHIEIWRYLKCNGWRGTSVGTEGDDVLSGHDAGGDSYWFVLIGRGGNDVLLADVVGDIMCGGPGDDRIYGAWGRDWIRGDAGNDYIEGGSLRDTIRGNKGDDHIDGERHGDVTFGNEGVDTIETGHGPDRIHAGPGNDNINGGEGEDRLNGGPGHDTCDGGDRGAADDVFQQCEEIVESPAPEGWYRMGVFAWRGGGAVFRHKADLDDETGLLWGANDSSRLIVGRDHTGDVVAEHYVAGGRPTDVQIADGQIFYLDSTADKVFVMSIGGVPLRDWAVPEVCEIEVTEDLVLVGVGGGTVRAYDHTGAFLFETSLTIGSSCGLSEHDGRIYTVVNESQEWYVAVQDLSGTVLDTLPPQSEEIRTFDVAPNGFVWIAGRDAGGWIRGFDLEGVQVAAVEGFEPAINGITLSLVADTNALWLRFPFQYQHGGADRIDVFTNLSCDGKSLTHVGTSYADELVTTSGVDVVHMGDGADSVTTGSGDDVVCGGRGNDTISGGDGDDELFGGNGDDWLDGGTGEDTCRGGNGDDTAVNCGVALEIENVAVRFEAPDPGWASEG